MKKRTAKWMYFLFLVLFVRLTVPVDFTATNALFVIDIPEIVLSSGNVSEEIPPVSDNQGEVPPVSDITPGQLPDVSDPVIPTPPNPTFPSTSPDFPENVSGTVTETPGADIGDLPELPTPPTVDPIVPNEPAVTEPIPEPISFSISLFEALGIVYVAGILIFALYQTVCYNVMIHSLKNSSIPCTDKEILKISETVCRELKIKRPLPVRISSAVSTPTLAGLLRPILLFPKNCNDENYLGYIFRHEYMHYKYGDLYFKLFALIANAFHWFNPVIYLLRREAEKVVEFNCDRRVIESYNGLHRSEYCNAILDEVERAILERKKSTSYMTTAFTGNKKTLKERLSSILDTDKKRRGVISFVVIVFLVVLASVIVSCNVSSGKEPGNDTDTPIEYKTPIPENVVINPVFEYVEIDPEVYNPHITTGDGELIDKLYSYIHKPYASAYAELVYRAEKTTVKNIDSYLMLMTVFNAFGVDGLETVRVYDETTSEMYTDYLIYPQKLMDERLKIIYGDGVKAEHGSFYPRDGVNAEYIAEEHYYRIYPYDLEWNRLEDFCNHYEYLRFEEKGKNIYIYENYYSTAYDYNNPCGPTACSGDFSTEFSLENGILPEYKHTFQKDKNGVFHWVSTELVTDLDTILLSEVSDALSKEENLAEELYSHILKDGFDVVYRNGVTTVEDVSMSNMQEIIHRIYGTKGLKRVMRSAVYDWQYYPDYWGDNVLFILPEELMEERIHEVFGKDAKIEHQSYELYNSSVFGKYSPEDKCYYLGVFSGLGEDRGDPSNSYYLGYENKGNEFIIYDKYVFAPRSPYITSIYRDCEMKDFVSAVSLLDDNIELPDGTDGKPVSAYYDHATVYKHTFKKASDGSYYWYSTEQATPENGISEAAGEKYVYSDSQKAYDLGLKLWNDFGLGEDGAYEYETSSEFLPPDGLGSINYNISNHIKENTDYIVFGIGGSPNEFGTQDAVAYYFAEEDGKYSLLLTDTGAYCGIPEYVYSYEDYLAYINGDESKFEALEYVFRKYMIGVDQQPSLVMENGPEKWDAYVSNTMVQRCKYFVSRNMTYVCHSQFNSLYGSNDAYLTLMSNGGYNYSSDFLIVSATMFLESVYIEDEVLDIIPREESSIYGNLADVVFKNGDYCVFALNGDNFRLISMTDKVKLSAPEPVDLSLTSDTKLFLEELFYRNDVDWKISSLNSFYTYELDSVVKTDFGNGYKYEVYCHLHENILYDEAYVKCTFGKIRDYYYLIDVSASDGPNGETVQLKISEKAEEPIPENVVLKPEVVYSSDTSNYTPHVDTGNGELINELYSYILKPYYTPYMELVYRNEKVTAESLEDYIKQMTVFAVFGVEGLEVRSEMCAYGYEVDFTIYPAALMEERAKIIYGDDVKIDHFTFYPLYYHTVEYIEDGHYYRFNADLLEQQWQSRKYNHSQFLRAEEQGDYIYIYDSYYNTEEFNVGYISTSNNIYAASLGRELVAEFIIDNGKKYRQRDPKTGEIVILDDFSSVIPEYKHAFKKDSDGEYHWVSTEPVTDIDSLVIEPTVSEDKDLNIATELYDYIVKYDYYGSELAYRRGTTKASDLSDYIKRLAVFENFGFNGLDIVMSGQVWQDSELARVKIVYPEELMEERVRKIFGSDVAFQHGSGTWTDGITVEYSAEDKCYYISAYDGGGDRPNRNFIYYLRHENKGDEFIIYDKYVFVDSYNGSHYLYRASEGEDFITTLKTENFEAYATVYKHTFKKAADGSYYWYSTEQANENNGISGEVGVEYVLSDNQKKINDVGRMLFEKYFNDEDYILSACISLENVFAHTPTMDESDYVIFVSGAQSADQVEALYFAEENGSYTLVYRDSSVKHHYPIYENGKTAFEWYLQNQTESSKQRLVAMTEEVLEEYPQVELLQREPLAQFQYLTSNIAYRCDTYESDGVLYVNFEDLNNLWNLPKRSEMDGITWDYSSGYVVISKGSPAENTYKDVEIRYLEPMHGYYADVIFATGAGKKYHATVLYEEDSVTVNGIHPFYDNFVITPDELADPEMEKTFVNELIEVFELDSYVSGLLTGEYTYEIMTESYENGGFYYQLYFSANESGVNMFDYVCVKIAKVGDGYYLYGNSRISSLPEN